MDILGPLPLTPCGNRYVLVVTDYFTKWTESYAIPNQEAATVAEKLVSQFVCRFGEPCELHSNQGTNFEFKVMAGDFNADLSQPDKPPKDGRTLLDLLDIFNLHCLITEPTRKTKTTQTTLDLILTNNKAKSVTSGVVDKHISDHSLVYTILRSSAPRARSRKICFHSLKNFSQENFVRDMQFVPFHIINLFDELDDKVYAFEQLFLGVINEHAPMKQTMIRGNQVPYMTKQWRKAIRHRHKLWKKFTCNRTDANYEAYKSQRNTCTSLRRKAIKQHFLKKSAETVNPQEFWSTFRPFLHTKTKQANDIVLNENDKIINDKKEIAELFNDHFVHITDGVPMIRENDYGENYVNHRASKQSMNTGAPALLLASVFTAQAKLKSRSY